MSAQEARVDVFDEEEGSKCLEGTLGDFRSTKLGRRHKEGGHGPMKKGAGTVLVAA
jgi:hypothetical protein